MHIRKQRSQFECCQASVMPKSACYSQQPASNLSQIPTCHPSAALANRTSDMPMTQLMHNCLGTACPTLRKSGNHSVARSNRRPTGS